ncbi:MAG: DNA-processing protein DprA, partial [Oscillospiraceae bacterium]|nr:DNA-processing protein DprA [Oscillospiraceae bacterium]
MSSLKYWIWLSALDGIGAVTAGRLLRRFDSPEQIFFARREEYDGIPEIRREEIELLCGKNLTAANRALAVCAENGYRGVTIRDAEYPERLRNIYGPPVVLYVRGTFPALDEEAAVAIVGTRSCTPYGITQAERTGYELARRGLLVVSGLARGIDSAAAKGALRAGGRVLGVLGCGLDVIYPAENGALYDDVASVGALLSEYPPGTPAVGAHFPIRNRILSGVSLGVAIIEAPKKSGALITASRALEQGRDVFALPGNVDSVMSAGANGLLRDGAIPLLTPDDIVSEYADLFPAKIASGRTRELVPIDEKIAGKLIRDQTDGAEPRRVRRKKEIDNEAPREYIDFSKWIETLPENEKKVASALYALA